MAIAYLPDLLNHLPAPRVLELGGRRVTAAPWQPPAHWQRLGLDVRPGPGVDLVGDAHDLREQLPGGRFDAIYSHAVFEHLAMPWRVALEMNRLLAPGGLAWVVTHEAFPVHEWPSDFWRFGPGAWESLFHPGTGFAILGQRPLQPAQVLPDAEPEAAFAGHLGCEVQVVKTGEPDPALRWEIDPQRLLARRRVYPGRARALSDRLGRGLRRVGAGLGLERRAVRSADDPWGLFGNGQSQPWTLVAGPDARPLPGKHLAYTGCLADSLADVPDGSLSRLALADVLQREAAPWAALAHARRVLASGGLLLVDACQVAPADQPGWRFSSAALPVLLHPASGFRLLRRGMFDACRIVGPEIAPTHVERAFRRTLGLARAEGPFDDRALAWPL